MSKYLRYITRVALLAIVYFVCAEISEMTIVSGGAATLIWPSAGIAIASLYLFGYSLWPGIVIGVLLSSMEDNLPFAYMGAIGATVSAVISVYLLKRGGFDRSLHRVKDVTKFIVYGAVLAPTISATIGVTGLLMDKLIGIDTFITTWLTWWVGDALGILVYAPVTLVWDRASLKRLLNLRNNISIFGFCVFLLLAIVVYIVFGLLPLSDKGVNPYKFMIMPIFPFIALYFSQRGNVTAIAFALTLAMTLTVIRYTSGQSYYLTLVILQQAVVMLSVSFMYVSAAIAERDAKQILLIRKTVELERKRAYYQQLSDAKDEFISTASHQLRTPATGVKMHLGMLRTGMLGSISQNQKASVDAAYDTNERLIMTIEDLLTTAELDAGELALNRENVDIKELLQEAIDNLGTVISGRDQTIDFHYGSGDYVRNIDSKKIAIVLENILNNASKYSYPKTTIYVDMAKRGGKVVITVRDEGVGIAKKDIHKLFNKFSRIPNELTAERSGNGLGLYLVKEIVKSHDGQIRVQSELGVGTTFTVSI